MSKTSTQWKEATLGDVAINASRPFDFLEKEEVIFLNTGDVLNGKFLHKEKSKVGSLRGQAKKAIERGDILFSEIRPANGRYALVDFDPVDYVVSTKFMVIKGNENIKERYLYQFLIYKNTVQEFQNIAESRSGTFPQITFDAVSYLPISLPPLDEQESILGVIESLDNKIELLRKQNETLEEIAKTVFNEWFVEFNFPDKDGKPYKASGGKMVESELGEIPEGWEVKPASGIADITIGRTPPRKETEWFSQNPKDIKWVSIRDMGSVGLYINNTSEYLTKEAVERFSIPTIPKDTVIVSFKLTVGRVAITTEEMLSNEAIAHFVQKDKVLTPSEYIYLWLKNFAFGTLGSTSSIANATNSQAIKRIPFLVPDTSVMEIFAPLASTIFEKIYANTIDIGVLSDVRDTLLPKLMNGEIRVNI